MCSPGLLWSARDCSVRRKQKYETRGIKGGRPLGLGNVETLCSSVKNGVKIRTTDLPTQYHVLHSSLHINLRLREDVCKHPQLALQLRRDVHDFISRGKHYYLLPCIPIPGHSRKLPSNISYTLLPMITARKVHFFSRGITVVGDLYIPDTAAPNRKNASIVVGHLGTGVKEQASGLYARCLAEHGFVALAFDAVYQGESGGEPRYLEDPYQRAEDFKSAVTFLSTLGHEVDPERIGSVGICASGGYSIFAAQTDLRLKAEATVCGVCWGSMTREGMKNSLGTINQEVLQQGLTYAGNERIAEAKGGQPATIAILEHLEEAKAYYKDPQWEHPRCPNLQLARSLDMLATYNSFAFIDWISPRPLLMIRGSEADKGDGGQADTGFYSRMAIERAKEPKELLVIKGKGHLDLYRDTAESIPKLVEFMDKSLCT
jgi:fermentation-respiration switch protein FrsA (DUF1100 family)